MDTIATTMFCLSLWILSKKKSVATEDSRETIYDIVLF